MLLVRKRYESESDLSLGDYDGLLEEYPGDALSAGRRRQWAQVRPVVNIICENNHRQQLLRSCH